MTEREKKKRRRTKHQKDLLDAVWSVHVRIKISFQVLDPNTDLKNCAVSLQKTYKAFTSCFVELTIHIYQSFFFSTHKQTLIEAFLPEESNPLRASEETQRDFCLFSVSVRGFD